MSLVRKYFRDLSITYKIVLIIFVTSGVSLAIAGASFVTYDIRAYKDSIVKDLSVEADIIAANSTAAPAARCERLRMVSSCDGRRLRGCRDGETATRAHAQLRPGAFPALRKTPVPALSARPPG